MFFFGSVHVMTAIAVFLSPLVLILLGLCITRYVPENNLLFSAQFALSRWLVSAPWPSYSRPQWCRSSKEAEKADRGSVKPNEAALLLLAGSPDGSLHPG